MTVRYQRRSAKKLAIEDECGGCSEHRTCLGCRCSTLSFPSREVGSVGGESEVDDVGSGKLLEELSTCNVEQGMLVTVHLGLSIEQG